MPLPVIPQTFLCRYVVTGSPLQRPATFGIHWHDTVGTQTEADLGNDLDANVSAGMWGHMSSNCGITKLDIIKLDGVSGSYQKNITAFPAKWTGSGGTDAILQGSLVVSIKSGLRGPKWRNRAYVGPIAEGKQQDGVLDATTLATAQTAWETHRTAMNTAGWALSVVSPSLAQETVPGVFLLRPYMKTQRRRARR